MSLVIIDISNPRNVEKSVQEVASTKLYNIDDLQSIADRNKLQRKKALKKRSKSLTKKLLFLIRI